ncbi:MAG: B12-binding domain-containing radical SAM protein [Thermoanaerobaculaceae bacterium]
MRILLVKPWPRLATVRGLQRFFLLEPLELGYLAAATPPGHDVRVLDLRLRRWPRRAFLSVLRSFRPDLVAFTGYTHESSLVKELAREVKRVLPPAVVVVGGHHATVMPADYDAEGIDAIVRGEGCGPFAAIVERLSRGGDLAGLPQVLLPGARFDHEATRGWPSFPDPASLPSPRRDLWRPQDYAGVWVTEHMPDWAPLFPPTSSVRTSFGCKMKCSFCVVPHLYGGQHRPRPVASVVAEIASLPTDHVYFCDDENFIDEAFALELADALARAGVRKRYFAWTRSTTVLRSPEVFRRWREIGLDGAFLGFEFPSDEELREADKGATVAANERALVLLRSFGVAVHAAFMVRPAHTRANFDRLREYVRQLPPVQCSFTVCTPSPGTADYGEVLASRWSDMPGDLHDCMHPLTPTALPLRQFCRQFAKGVAESGRKNPMRAKPHPVHVRDTVRVVVAEALYVRALRRMYRDFPRELWA